MRTRTAARGGIAALGLIALVLSAFQNAIADTRVLYVTGSATRICQVTGDFDRANNAATLNRTDTRFGVHGTDLGYPVEHNGRLYLLYGDTSGAQTRSVDFTVEVNPPGTPAPTATLTYNLDSVAFTTDAVPDDCLALNFITDPARADFYAPPQIDLATYPSGSPHLGHSTFMVPASGFSRNGDFYVFFARFISNPVRRSILAKISDPDLRAGNLGRFRYVYEVSRAGDQGVPGGYPGDPGDFGRFVNIVPVPVDNASVPGLPQSTGSGLLLWGSGSYRESNAYLAYVAMSDVENRAAWWYYTGTKADGSPDWRQNAEVQTQPMFLSIPGSAPHVGCIGEFSAAWNAYLERWLMIYNCGFDPRGIRFHVAPKPWGPWSEVKTALPERNLLFDPSDQVDKGYLYFLHLAYGTTNTCTADAQCNDNNPTTVDRCNPTPDPKDNVRYCQHAVNDGLDDDGFGTVVNGQFVPGPRRFWEGGGEYAPYLLSRYTTGGAGRSTVYFLMSTWNPYQAALMKSTLRLERPPVSDAGPDRSVDAGAVCTASVALDGSASNDPDGDPLSYKWTGPFGTVSGTATPTVTLPLGRSTITLEVDDGLGGIASDTVDITVRDITPPTISLALSPAVLWPPNHRMVPITASVTTLDNCDLAPRVRLASVTSNEAADGLGDGATAADVEGAVVGTDDRAFSMRAERSGGGNGRVYTVRYRATDASGNSAEVTRTISVPHEAP